METIIDLIKDTNTIIFILGTLIGFNTGWNFSDFDDWIKKKIPEDFKDTFTYYIIDKILKIIHHYMIGLGIAILFYPPHNQLSLLCLGFGLGLFIEETDIFTRDLRKLTEKFKKLKSLHS